MEKAGLADVDIAGSTGPLNGLPLYEKPWVVLPHVYSPDMTCAEPVRSFPTAHAFHDSIIKIPVWAYADEEAKVNQHVQTFVRVANEAAGKRKRSNL